MMVLICFGLTFPNRESSYVAKSHTVKIFLRAVHHALHRSTRLLLDGSRNLEETVGVLYLAGTFDSWQWGLPRGQPESVRPPGRALPSGNPRDFRPWHRRV